MQKLFVTSCLLAGLAGGSAAQAQRGTDLYYIDLAGQPLDVPGRTFYIGQVEDGRARRATIGSVRRGFNNAEQRAELKLGVAPGLQALFTTQLPARPTDQPVLAVVRALQVSEHIAFSSEEATDEVAIDYYLLDAGGAAHLALSTSETSSSKGLETTARHPRQLAQALQAGLRQLAALDWAAVAARPGQPVTTLLAAPAAEPAYAILADSLRPAGFYRTFSDFRDNHPITAPALLVETQPATGKGWEGTTEYLPYLQEPGGGRGEALRGAWGFADGRQLYIYHRRKYRLLVRRPGGFGFVGGSEADPGAVSTAGLLGGALGAGIAAASTSGRPTDYVLSLRTGRVTGGLASEDASLPDTVLLHVYCRKSIYGAKPQPVYLNDALVGELAENQQLIIPFTDHVGKARLRLGTEKDRELVLQPDFLAPLYVKVARNPTDETRLPLEVVSAKVGEFDLRGIKLAAGAE